MGGKVARARVTTDQDTQRSKGQDEGHRANQRCNRTYAVISVVFTGDHYQEARKSPVVMIYGDPGAGRERGPLISCWPSTAGSSRLLTFL